jgi:hypothetical protein
LLTGSAFVYFMQPALGMFPVGLLFAGSALFNRPIVERFVTDVCPLDGGLMARPCMRRFFLRLSGLWCAVMTVNAGLALYFLVETSLRAFLVERAVVCYTLTLGGVIVSIGWFVSSMRNEGIAVRFRRHRGVTVESAAVWPTGRRGRTPRGPPRTVHCEPLVFDRESGGTPRLLDC